MASPITLRPATAADTANVGRVAYDAFDSIAKLRNFPHDFPSPEAAMGLAGVFTQHPNIFGVVAECDGRFVGSNFLDERDAIRAVGPITVDPAFQGKGAGRRLMEAVLDRGRGARGIRLLQDAHNTVSMSLYASLGFEVKEPVVLMAGRPTGQPTGQPRAGGDVRPLAASDLPAAAELCSKVHGLDRNGELADAMKMFGSPGLFRNGRLVAYCSAPPLWPLNHGVAESEADLTDLILAASAAAPEPFMMLVPTRSAGLFRWCLKSGMRVVKPLSLMSIGEYHEPAGAYFPSVGY